MVPATDSASPFSARRARLPFAALLVAAALGAGCTQIRSFRKGPPPPPAFGTEASEHGARSDDLYAEHLAPSLKRSREALARESAGKESQALVALSSPEGRRQRDDLTAPPENEPAGSTAKPVAEPLVALRPPVSIPPIRFETPTGAPGVMDPVTVAAVKTPDRVIPAEAPAQATPAEPSLNSVLAESRSALDKIDAYRVRTTHQERVGGALQAPEDIVMNIRRHPKAVRLEWPDGPSKGREVLYAADSGGGQMHVRMPNPLLPRISMAPDSPLAVRNSRHPIYEAGFDTIVEGMEAAVRGNQNGDPSFGPIRYVGMEKPEGLKKTCQKIVRVSPEKETWTVYLDPDTHLPALVQAETATGDLLERHVFDDPSLNVADLASRDAFDPDARWGVGQGFLQRLARSANGPAKETNTR